MVLESWESVHLGQKMTLNSILTVPELKGACMQHYNRALKKHLFSTLGSLQALGNPVGLVRGMVGDLI